jgi:branched-chain amino acid transport system ATP-binding protein
MTVMFVEHDMDVVHDISDWVVVMAQGRVIAEGPADALSSNKAVVDAYLGAHHDQALEFDADGNPVGQTAVLVAEIESELEAAIERGEDLSASPATVNTVSAHTATDTAVAHRENQP